MKIFHKGGNSLVLRMKRAFTILEVMVAMALLSLVVVEIYSSWNSILKGSRVALDAAAAAQRTRITVRTVHDAFLCSCMFNATGATNYYTFIPGGEGDYSAVSFVARLPKSFPRSGKFGDFSIRRVEFTVEPDGNRGKQLVMRQRPVIMDFDKIELESPLILAKNVKRFTIEYSDPMDQKLADWSSDWEQTNKLPREVRVTIQLGTLDQYSNKEQDSIVDVVALPCVSVQAGFQVPALGGPGGVPGAAQPGQPGQPGAPPGQRGPRLPPPGGR